MNIALLCECEGKDPFCNKCEGHENLEVIQTCLIPYQFDFDTLKFEPVTGLFQIFMSGEEVIGAENIEFQRDFHSYFVYELQSFWGEEGHKIMIDTMLAAGYVDSIEGNCRWEDCFI